MDVPSDVSVKDESQASEYSPETAGTLELPVTASDGYALNIGDHLGLS